MFGVNFIVKLHQPPNPDLKTHKIKNNIQQLEKHTDYTRNRLDISHVLA